MSDRDEKDVCWDGGAHCDRHRSLGKCCHCGKKFAAPVEPPVLSREFFDKQIALLGTQSWGAVAAQEKLRDAILESLSQEDG